MSANSQPVMMRASCSIFLSDTLSEAEQKSMEQLLALLPVDSDYNHDSNMHSDINNNKHSNIHLKCFVDGRGLACPMPLLKTKVALRDVGINESLYVVATDPNSQADIMAFCRQQQQANNENQLLLSLSKVTKQPLADGISTQRFDTIYHFIITKTDSN